MYYLSKTIYRLSGGRITTTDPWEQESCVIARPGVINRGDIPDNIFDDMLKGGTITKTI